MSLLRRKGRGLCFKKLRSKFRTRWDAAVYAAAIVAAFLLLFEMLYFLNINENDSRAVLSVFFNMGRNLIFIILGVEVLTWYKLALDRIKGGLERSCTEG